MGVQHHAVPDRDLCPGCQWLAKPCCTLCVRDGMEHRCGRKPARRLCRLPRCAPPLPFILRAKILAEFVPGSHQYLLTVLSIWWALGQLVGSLIAWPLIVNFSCSGTTPATCPRAQNQGWRYFMYCMGGIMLFLSFLRFGVFHLYESPKYLMGRGRDADAVEVVHKLAAYNGTTSRLTLEMLREAELSAAVEDEPSRRMDTSARAAVLRKLRTLSTTHLRSLFATKKLAFNTTLLMLVWGKHVLTLLQPPFAHHTPSRSHWACIPAVSTPSLPFALSDLSRLGTTVSSPTCESKFQPSLPFADHYLQL